MFEDLGVTLYLRQLYNILKLSVNELQSAVFCCPGLGEWKEIPVACFGS